MTTPRFPDDFDVLRLAGRLRAAGRTAGFRVVEFGHCLDVPLFALERPGPPGTPLIYCSAGIHGDEPAPPLALCELLGAGFFDDRAGWLVCPLLNPSGLSRRTRENHEGVDLNRDYREPTTAEIRSHVAWLRRQPDFAAAFCLHEDWEARGFYLYELNPQDAPSLARALLAAARAHLPIDESPEIDGRPARGGLIRPVDDPALRDRWPEAIYLRAHHTPLCYTLETPSAFPLAPRIAAHAAALAAGVAALLAPRR